MLKRIGFKIWYFFAGPMLRGVKNDNGHVLFFR